MKGRSGVEKAAGEGVRRQERNRHLYALLHGTTLSPVSPPSLRSLYPLQPLHPECLADAR